MANQEREALEQIEKMSSLCGGLSWPKALERLTAVRDRARAVLAAREDAERPACPICGTHEWIPDVGCRRCAEGGAKGCGQCWTCKAHQEGLYGDVECETRFEGRIRAMRDERKRKCQANAPLCVHGEWPSQCPPPYCPGLQNPPDETIALAAREDTERP